MKSFPQFTNDFTIRNSYSMEEGNTADVPISLAISGNPKPNVMVKFDGTTNIKYVTNLIKPYTYNYTFLLKNVNIEKCGKKVKIYATDYTNTTTMHVFCLILHNKPQNVSADIIADRCVHIKWDKMVSNECNISFSIIYVYHNNEIISFQAKVEHDYTDCVRFDASLIARIYLQSITNGQLSSYNKPVILNQIKQPINKTSEMYVIIILGVFLFISLVVNFMLIMQNHRSLEDLHQPRVVNPNDDLSNNINTESGIRMVERSQAAELVYESLLPLDENYENSRAMSQESYYKNIDATEDDTNYDDVIPTEEGSFDEDFVPAVGYEYIRT